MTPDKLLDAIGMLDERFFEEQHKPRTVSLKRKFTALLAAVLIISGFLMFNFGFALGIRRDSFVQDAIDLIQVFRWCFVVAFPLVLVSLCIAGYGRRLKKALPLQLILLV